MHAIILIYDNSSNYSSTLDVHKSPCNVILPFTTLLLQW